MNFEDLSLVVQESVRSMIVRGLNEICERHPSIVPRDRWPTAERDAPELMRKGYLTRLDDGRWRLDVEGYERLLSIRAEGAKS